MRKYLRDYLSLILPATAIVAFDQWTKWIVSTNLDLGEMWAPWPWLMPYARFVHWSNTGSAFGLFQGFGLVFTILAILVAIFILYYFPKVERSEWIIRTALTMQMGGAVGNLVDRLRQGYVTDFISVGNFAVFNVADSFISIGTVVLLIGMYQYDKKEQQMSKESNQTPNDELLHSIPEESQGE